MSNEPPSKVVDLQTAVSSLVLSVIAARVALDQESVRLAELYQQNEILQQLSAPSFGINEATLRLPYAAFDVYPSRGEIIRALKPEELPHMLVQINADMIARLPPHSVGQVELKLTPQVISFLLEQLKP